MVLKTRSRQGREREGNEAKTNSLEGKAGEEGQARAHAGKKQKAGRKVQKGSCWGWGMLGNDTYRLWYWKRTSLIWIQV